MNLCSNVPSNLRPGKNLIMLYKQLVILYKPPFDKYLIGLKDINEMFYQILITEAYFRMIRFKFIKSRNNSNIICVSL